MDVNELFDSKYLKKEDLKGPVVATISGVTTDMFTERGSTQKKKKGVLHFVGGQIKSMSLNITNSKVLVNLYGKNTDEWIGKSIEIWVNPSIEMGGEIVGGLRLRAPVHTAAKLAIESLASNGPLGTSVMNLPMALAALAEVGLTKDNLRFVLVKQGNANGYKPERDTATVQAMIKEARENQEFGFSPDEEVPL